MSDDNENPRRVSDVVINVPHYAINEAINNSMTDQDLLPNASRNQMDDIDKTEKHLLGADLSRRQPEGLQSF